MRLNSIVAVATASTATAKGTFLRFLRCERLRRCDYTAESHRRFLTHSFRLHLLSRVGGERGCGRFDEKGPFLRTEALMRTDAVQMEKLVAEVTKNFALAVVYVRDAPVDPRSGGLFL